MTNDAGIHNGKKTAAYISIVGELDRYRQKVKVELFYTIYKNKLKVDQRPKCKTRNRKTPRRYKHHNFDINLSNIYMDLFP